MRRILATLALAALAAAAAGCLVSGTKVFTYDVGSLNLNPGTGFDSHSIDLSGNSTYNEHRDDISLIDRVGFECGLVNNGTVARRISIYFSRTAGLDAADVPTQAMALCTNVDVPATRTGTFEDRVIDYDTSISLLQNFDAFAKVVQEGTFTLYVLSDDAQAVDVDITDLVLVVTFTVGL